jgi:hypothetical protein
VRRRVQQAQTGHRGRAGDPLYGLYAANLGARVLIRVGE